MKNMEKILLLTIIISSFHIVSDSSEIQFSDLLPILYANEKQDNYSQSIVLKHKDDTSIIINEGTEVRINKKLKTYYFSSYNARENKILLKNKKSKIIVISLSDIATISMRLNYVEKNIFTGLLGGVIGGYLGMIPSMMTGCIVGMTFFPGHQDYGMSSTGMIVTQGIALAGAIKSAQYGYHKGANLGNPFFHFNLIGTNSWGISIPEVNSQDVN